MDIKVPVSNVVMPKVVSGFPGIGKSYFTTCVSGVSDSDSSKFPKENFPQNYMEHIKALLAQGTTRYIMVSSHDAVRAALVEAGIPYNLVYPSLDQKLDYMTRYEKRGSPEAFLKLMDSHWDVFIQECQRQEGCNKIELKKGQFLFDVSGELL